MPPHPDTLKLVCQLLEQLCEAPERADTAEGIARWWLPESVDMLVLNEALQWLKEQELMEMRIAADRRLRWRRKADLPVLLGALQRLTPTADPRARPAP